MIGYLANKWVLLLCCIILLSGCVPRKSPEVTYYSLLTMEQLGTVQSISSHPEINLGIGPISIPDSLRRSQVATRTNGNQYVFDEFNRWAGVLEKDITAVVGDNLGALLGVEKVGFYPWMPHFKPTYRILIGILRLDGTTDSEAVLWARWSVADSSGKELLSGGKAVFTQALETPGYASLVKAESLLVAELSKKIADEINGLLDNP